MSRLCYPRRNTKKNKRDAGTYLQETDKVSAENNIKNEEQDIDLNKIKDIKKSSILLQEEQSKIIQRRFIKRYTEK